MRSRTKLLTDRQTDGRVIDSI